MMKNISGKTSKSQFIISKNPLVFIIAVPKNILELYIKTEMELKKNIYFAKLYLKEAIKEEENPYSMYNLARIYYFGIIC